MDTPLDERSLSTDLFNTFCTTYLISNSKLQLLGMMKTYTFFSLVGVIFQLTCCIKIRPELQRNILNFGYGINYKYEGIATIHYETNNPPHQYITYNGVFEASWKTAIIKTLLKKTWFRTYDIKLQTSHQLDFPLKIIGEMCFGKI